MKSRPFYCAVLFLMLMRVLPAQAVDRNTTHTNLEIACVENIRVQYQQTGTSCTIRLIFKKAQDGWISFPQYPPGYAGDEHFQAVFDKVSRDYMGRRNWIEVHNGKILFEYTSDLLSPFHAWADIGIHQLVQTNAPRDHLSYYEESDEGGPRNPHVLLRSPCSYSVKDPDGWTTTPGVHLAPNEEILIRGRMAEAYVGAAMTSLSEAEINKRIKLRVDRALQSNDGAKLIKILAVYSDSRMTFWLARPKEGSPLFLSTGHFQGADTCIEYPEMKLLDYGDFDGDGHSEFIFALYGYDYGGYRLFWDDFHGSATFDWIYH